MIPADLTISDSVVTLRTPTVDDSSALARAVQESIAEISPWMNWCTADYDEEMARSWLATLSEAWDA